MNAPCPRGSQGLQTGANATSMTVARLMMFLFQRMLIAHSLQPINLDGTPRDYLASQSQHAGGILEQSWHGST